MKKYLCPPKLQTKLLLLFWTVPEIMILGVGVLCGALFSMPLLVISLTAAILLARFNLENNMAGKIIKILKYYIKCKTYRRS